MDEKKSPSINPVPGSINALGAIQPVNPIPVMTWLLKKVKNNVPENTPLNKAVECLDVLNSITNPTAEEQKALPWYLKIRWWDTICK